MIGITQILPQRRTFKLLSIKHVFLYCYIFLFIFTPFILPATVNIIHILAIIAYFGLLMNYRLYILPLLGRGRLRIFFLFHIILALYTFFLSLFTGNDLANTYYIVSTIFEVLPICIFISLMLIRLNITKDQFFNVILLMGVIQFIVTLLAFLFPSFREVTLTFFPKEGVFEEYFGIAGEFRMFGFTRYYTFAMPLFMGLCVIISFVLGVVKSKYYFILTPLFLFPIIYNARVGLLALPVVLIVVFLFQLRKNFFKQVLLVIAFIWISMLSLSFIERQAMTSSGYNTWTWLNDGIKQVQLFSEGKNEGHFEALADDMWVLPEEEALLLGTGENIFMRHTGNSDIGYVLNLYYGGIVYCVLLYYAFITVIVKYGRNGSIERLIAISLLLFLFIANFKGTVFRTNEIVHGIMLMVTFSVCYKLYSINEAGIGPVNS